jgi:hypothetical protein
MKFLKFGNYPLHTEVIIVIICKFKLTTHVPPTQGITLVHRYVWPIHKYSILSLFSVTPIFHRFIFLKTSYIQPPSQFQKEKSRATNVV